MAKIFEGAKEGLRDFIKTQEYIKGKIEHYKTELSRVEEKIEFWVAEPINQVRLLQGKDTGTISVMVEGVEVKHDLPKKVEWDQEKMKQIVNRIENAGDNPDEYVSAKYSVSEKEYKKFLPAIQTIFMQAREIKTGKPKITFKIKKED